MALEHAPQDMSTSYLYCDETMVQREPVRRRWEGTLRWTRHDDTRQETRMCCRRGARAPAPHEDAPPKVLCTESLRPLVPGVLDHRLEGVMTGG